MKTKWPTKKLGDICVKITDGSHNPPKGVEVGFPMLSSRNIFNHGINFEGARFLTEEDFASENKRTDVEPGDVLLTIVGTIGRVIVIPKGLPKFTLQRSVAVIKTGTEIDEYYLAQYLSSPDVQEYFMSQARGGAQKGFYLKDIKDLDIPLPSLEEQKRIVKVLEEKLGKVKEAIEFRQDAIADTEKILSAKLSEIFADGKEKGWKEKSFSDKEVLKMTSGGTPSRANKNFYKGIILWLKSGELKDNRNIIDSKEKISEDAVKRSSAKLFPPGSVLFAMYGATAGKIGILGVEASTNQAVAALIPVKEVLNNNFLYYFLMKKRIEIIEQAWGGAQPNLSQTILKQFSIPLPDLKTQEKIVKGLDELSVQVAKLRTLQDEQLADLKSLERAYLHEAFNGELA